MVLAGQNHETGNVVWIVLNVPPDDFYVVQLGGPPWCYGCCRELAVLHVAHRGHRAQRGPLLGRWEVILQELSALGQGLRVGIYDLDVWKAGSGKGQQKMLNG